jgi:hypothetical protein
LAFVHDGDGDARAQLNRQEESMKTTRLLVVVAAAALLAACATLPPPEEGNKTLLAVAVKTLKAGGYALSYEFGLKESQEKLVVHPRSGVVVFANLPPGSYTIDKLAVVPGPGIAGGQYTGSIKPDPFGPVAFKLVEGQTTILPFALVLEERSTAANVTTQLHGSAATNRDEPRRGARGALQVRQLRPLEGHAVAPRRRPAFTAGACAPPRAATGSPRRRCRRSA